MSTIIVSTDMEGITGVSRWSQVTPTSSEYDQGCDCLRHDVAIVLDELSKFNHEVIVVDGHWTGTNLKPADVGTAHLLSGTRMPWGMVEGVQHKDVVGVILLGYHGCAGSAGAMAHTWDTCFTEVRLNGEVVGEITLAAMLSHQCGVPIIGVSGDDHACTEARTVFVSQKEVFHDVFTAEVKRSLSYESVEHYSDAESRLRLMVKDAMTQVGRFNPSTDRFVIEARFMNHNAIDRAGLLPGSMRSSHYTLQLKGSAKECFDAMRVWAMLAEG